MMKQFEIMEAARQQIIAQLKLADLPYQVDGAEFGMYVTVKDGETEIDVPMTKTVAMTTQASTDFDTLCQDGRLAMIDKSIIQHLIAQDPRVAYRQAEIEVVSTMRYGEVDVDFWMDEMGVMVITGLRVVDE